MSYSDTMTTFFQNRVQAGIELARQVISYQKEDPIIIALPRGGVVVGYEVAKLLQRPLNILVVKKLGSPYNPEYAIGALAEGGITLLSKQTVNLLDIPLKMVSELVKKEKKEMHKRIRMFRKYAPFPQVKNKTIIVVDDGLATGFTAKAAILALKKKHAKKIIFISPVCQEDASQTIHLFADEIICLTTPREFFAVSSFYHSFPQVTTKEVLVRLKKAQKNPIVSFAKQLPRKKRQYPPIKHKQIKTPHYGIAQHLFLGKLIPAI